MNFEKEKWVPIFALYKHEFLGYLFSAYAIQLTENGLFSYNYKRIFSETIVDFEPILDTAQKRLITWLDECDQQKIIKRFYKKFIKPPDFFQKHYNKEIEVVIEPFIEKRMALFLQNAADQFLFVQGSDGYPASKRINYHKQYGKIRFHLKRNETETRYYPTTLLADQRIHLARSKSNMIVKKPVWLLSETDLYALTANVDFNKVLPFLQKNHIAVPQSAESIFYEKFLPNLLTQHEIRVEGLIEMQTVQQLPIPVLKLSKDLTNEWVFSLYFKYDDELVPANHNRYALASINYSIELVQIIRKQRNAETEANFLKDLAEIGFEHGFGNFLIGPNGIKGLELINFVAENADYLREIGCEILQSDAAIRFALEPPLLETIVKDKGDWFDIAAEVSLGGFRIPIKSLRYNILNHIATFQLPDGRIAAIPEIWFSRLKTMYRFSEETIDGEPLKLRKIHAPIIEQILNKKSVSSGWYNQLIEKGIESDQEMHLTDFKADLRPYQRAGFDWMCFMRRYQLGGCLADDMGLGKTVQTIALLQADWNQRKIQNSNHLAPSLIVVPTSLLYNWQFEIAKFAPKLRQMVYAGNNRKANRAKLQYFAIVIVSYGTLRADIEWFSKQKFHYLILDEGQAIKNPHAKVTQAVLRLNAQNRLLLSGTPIENSVQDIWPIMEFLNPNLLGSLADFKSNFQAVIERDPSSPIATQLRSLINPFVLRRTKKQVAQDLPDKVEQVLYCNMTEEQEKLYQETKNSFRNEIWEMSEKFGLAKANMLILRGLTRLRQIANHPAMVDSAYNKSSGKFEEMIQTLEIALSENHKMLIFSQFIKHLHLVRNWLDLQKIPYFYLDGATDKRKRIDLVNAFNEPTCKTSVFLISLKAGGVGLNLTAADYVFMLDPWWNPFAELQAIDRTHRIGQKNTVFTYRFITVNSVEEKILQLQAHKRLLSDQLIAADASFVKSLTIKDLEGLFS